MNAGPDAVRAGRYRDLLSGIICMVAGLGALMAAKSYGIGSLDQIGPGFYPGLLGGLLSVTGLLIAVTAFTNAPEAAEIDPILDGGGDLLGSDLVGPDWRGWFCIIAGVVLFIVCAWLSGLATAIFGCVFVAALGDRTASLKGCLLLALVMTVGGTVLFGYFLGINMPLWQWPFSP